MGAGRDEVCGFQAGGGTAGARCKRPLRAFCPAKRIICPAKCGQIICRAPINPLTNSSLSAMIFTRGEIMDMQSNTQQEMQAFKIIFDLRCQIKGQAPKHLAQEAKYFATADYDLSNVRQYCWQHATRIENRLKQDKKFESVKAHSYLMPIENVASAKVLCDANALKLVSGQVKSLIKNYAYAVDLGTSLRFSNEFNNLLDINTQGPKQKKTYDSELEA